MTTFNSWEYYPCRKAVSLYYFSPPSAKEHVTNPYTRVICFNSSMFSPSAKTSTIGLNPPTASVVSSPYANKNPMDTTTRATLKPCTAGFWKQPQMFLGSVLGSGELWLSSLTQLNTRLCYTSGSGSARDRAELEIESCVLVQLLS